MTQSPDNAAQVEVKPYDKLRQYFLDCLYEATTKETWDHWVEKISWVDDLKPAPPAPDQTAQDVCAELYQVLGALNAPANVLDNCVAIANGEKPPHKTLLPFIPDNDQTALIDALKALHDYGKERAAQKKDCDATFVERCAYTALSRIDSQAKTNGGV